jgi:hypothetical protein
MISPYSDRSGPLPAVSAKGKAQSKSYLAVMASLNDLRFYIIRLEGGFASQTVNPARCHVASNAATSQSRQYGRQESVIGRLFSLRENPNRTLLAHG